MSILDTIAKQRLLDVEEAMAVLPMDSLVVASESRRSERERHVGGMMLSLHHVLLESKDGFVKVAAEFKRASPSKGVISMDLQVKDQVLTYSKAGARVISVLTEPTWFKGTLEDLQEAREFLQTTFGNDRPVMLRKDFIVHPYQIYEAVYYGADTILLIVAILSKERILEFLALARSLGMEPLVEVANESEMLLALECGSLCIGINNRDLHSFKVDMNASERLTTLAFTHLKEIGDDRKLCILALSGISARGDVERFQKAGVCGILVGEALMKAKDPMKLIDTLIGRGAGVETRSSNEGTSSKDRTTRVKICGIQTVSSALAACRYGCDYIGMIFVEGSRRCVSEERGKEISLAVQGYREKGRLSISEHVTSPIGTSSTTSTGEDAIKDWMHSTSRALDSIKFRPLVVGVFRNQSVEVINHIVEACSLDIVQLHGDEDWNMCKEIKAPVFKVLHIQEGSTCKDIMSQMKAGLAYGVVLDTEVKSTGERGGSGVSFDWKLARELSVDGGLPVMVAGGLRGDNVSEAIRVCLPWGVDVSSGVEKDGSKDDDLIKEFIERAKDS